MRLGLYLWDLMLSPGRWGQIELNFRTPSWYLRVAWWCGRKKKHIGVGVIIRILRILLEKMLCYLSNVCY